MKSVSIVIPAYNEVNGISATLTKVAETIDSASLTAEIIVVDDGSTDGTPARIAAHPEVRLIQHPQNKGYGASLKTGIRQARYETIVIIDADGTYPCDMIPVLLAEMDTYDMVVGARTGEKVQIPLIRRPAKWALTRLANYLSGAVIPDLNSGLRAFDREIVTRYFRLLPSGFSFTTTITLALLTNDYNVKFIPIDYFHRTGRSKIRPIQDTINFFSLVVRMVLAFRPLRVLVPICLLMLTASFIKIGYDITSYDWHIATSTVVLVTTTFQMIILGLIADLVVSLNK